MENTSKAKFQMKLNFKLRIVHTFMTTQPTRSEEKKKKTIKMYK